MTTNPRNAMPPPPPDTIPDLPQCAPPETDSATWRAILETSRQTVPAKGRR